MFKLIRPSLCLLSGFLTAASWASTIKYFTPGTNPWSINAISRDGSTVVGACMYPDAFTQVPFKYNTASGVTTPISAPGNSEANSSSANGSVLAGDVGLLQGLIVNGTTASQPTHSEIFYGVSDNGLVAVGTDADGNAIRYSGGVATILAYAYHPSAGLTYSLAAYAADATGSTIVGSGFDSNHVAHPAIWTSGAPYLLPIPNGFQQGAATAISADGQWTAGYFTTGGSFTEARGFIYHLGRTTLFGTPVAANGVINVYSISNDGSMLACMATTPNFGDEYFIKTPAGSIDYKTYFSQNGVNVGTGITLTGMSGMSGDGLKFIGSWTGPNYTRGGYVVTIIPPKIKSLVLSSGGIVGGNSVIGTVTLDSIPGATVSISSSDLAVVPSGTVMVAKGSLTGSGSVATHGIATAKTVVVTASLPGSSATSKLVVNPASLAALKLSSISVVGGNSVTGTITLNGEPSSGGAKVTISHGNSAVVSHVPTLLIPGSAVSGTVSFNTMGVASTQSVLLSATFNGVTKTSSLQVLSATLQTPIIPKALVGGNLLNLIVALNGKAPAGGFPVGLKSNNPTILAVPSPTLTIPAQTSSTSELLKSYGVDTAASVVLTVSHSSTTHQSTVVIEPAKLKMLYAPYKAVVSGANVPLSVILNGDAGPAGIKVNLSSSDPTDAPVPASVTVLHNTASKAIVIASRKVVTTTIVTFTATPSSGPSVQVKVTLNP